MLHPALRSLRGAAATAPLLVLLLAPGAAGCRGCGGPGADASDADSGGVWEADSGGGVDGSADLDSGTPPGDAAATDAAEDGGPDAAATDAGCTAPDADGDGFTACTGDCDDSNPATHPGAAEICGDGIANDCSPGAPDAACMGLGTYVAPPPLGADGAAGTQASPVDDVNEAMVLSALIEAMGGPSDLPVHVAADAAGPGVYEEEITLVEGISLLGGYEPTTWTRNAAVNVTILNPGAGGILADASITRATAIEGFTINAMRSSIPSGPTTAIAITGGAPTIDGNVINAIAGPDVDVAVSISGGGVVPAPSPLLTRNTISAAGGGGAAAYGITGDGHAAEIRGNVVLMASAARSIGIHCASCTPSMLLAGNTVDGSAAVSDTAIGLELDMASAVIDSNFVHPGACLLLLPSAQGCIGVTLGEASILINNVIFGGSAADAIGVLAGGVDWDGAGYLASEIHHNYVNGGGLAGAGSSVSAGIVLGDPPSVTGAVTIHGNVVHAGAGAEHYAIFELDAGADPVDVLNNDLRVPPAAIGGIAAFYLDEGATALLTLADVNTLPDVFAAANIELSCAFVSETWGGDFHLTFGSPCIDGGTPVGAPPFDFEGDGRDALPDIGPDEL